MTTVQKLFTNSTNRFFDIKPIILSSSQSNFTPLQQSSSTNSQFIQSQIIPSPQFNFLQTISQTYSQLQDKFKQLTKSIHEANHEKQLMSMLFQKVFLIENGKQQKMKKRFRRKKTQIQSKFSCELCSKIYSSSTSLAWHAKLKHSYTLLQPPLNDYEIPPQPNSVVDSSDVSKPDETGLNQRCQKDDNFINEEDSQQFESGQDQLSEQSEIQQEIPLKKGLS